MSAINSFQVDKIVITIFKADGLILTVIVQVDKTPIIIKESMVRFLFSQLLN